MFVDAVKSCTLALAPAAIAQPARRAGLFAGGFGLFMPEGDLEPATESGGESASCEIMCHSAGPRQVIEAPKSSTAKAEPLTEAGSYPGIGCLVNESGLPRHDVLLHGLTASAVPY